MIVFENKALERAVLQGDSCIAVPIDVFVGSDGECTITTYESAKPLSEEFSKLYSGKMLSNEAVEWIDNSFSAFAEKFGYEHSSTENDRMIEFCADDKRQLNKPMINGECIKIDSNDELARFCEKTGCDIEIDGGDDIIFAVVRDGIILSYAGVNDVFYKGKALEINVETALEERGKGYGSAVVYELSVWLIDKGYKVLYKCAKSNLASIALAKSCGFTYMGERYSYVCYVK